MKKIYWLIFLVIINVLFIDTVNAANKTYYRDEFGNYTLCVDKKCKKYSRSEIINNGGLIDGDSKKLTFNDETYKQVSAPTKANEETDWGTVKDITPSKVCSEPSLRKPLKLIGTFVILLKILIPILVIVFGFIDLFKAVTSSKQDNIPKALTSIAIRVVAGLFIFFLPGIIQVILDLVNEWSEYENTWCCCTQCVLDANNCDVNSCSSKSCKIGGMN